ncbi:MAG: dTDP-4-dehydrorhamnose 3,5-epimerase [bacterium]|nr:dTDP-4-dehydrorhamnose 3,5-epimerase [bacterium]
MKTTTIEIPGPLIVQPKLFHDNRGHFAQIFAAKDYARQGIEVSFVQDNYSVSLKEGTVRGMHYQLVPCAQSKLIHVVAGAVWNVIVDLRQGSQWFGKWWGIELSAENHTQLFLPEGFANGFCALTGNAAVCYKVDRYYSPEHERGFRWNDQSIGIDWPVKEPILSERDRSAPLFEEAEHNFSMVSP